MRQYAVSRALASNIVARYRSRHGHCHNAIDHTVEYSETLPQVFLSHTRQFVLDHQNTPPGCHTSLHWQAAQETPGAREG